VNSAASFICVRITFPPLVQTSTAPFDYDPIVYFALPVLGVSRASLVKAVEAHKFQASDSSSFHSESYVVG
jgi:hypothetical protein